MNEQRSWLIFALLGIAAITGQASVEPHIGFVYPAGGTPGSTLTVTIGGQHLTDVAGVLIGTHAIASKPTDSVKIYERREMNRVRRSREILEARMAEETDPTRLTQMQRALESVMAEQEMVTAQRREMRRNRAEAARRQFNPQIAERITLEIPIPPGLATGDTELRLLTERGISNPLRFQIGQIPEVNEVENNDTFANAQRLPELPVLVNGQIMPGDIDRFRFRARAGQVIVCRLQARALIPYLADAVPGWFQAVLKLEDAAGNEVAYSDDFGGDPDPVLIYEVPADGEYVISLRDSIFRGREDFVYRLSIGELPFIARAAPLGGTVDAPAEVQLFGANLPGSSRTITVRASTPGVKGLSVTADGLASNTVPFQISRRPVTTEREANDTAEQAQVLTAGAVVHGTLDRAGDRDWFRFTGRRGVPLTLEVFARRLGSPVDSRIAVFDTAGQLLATNDDAEDPSFGLMTHHADSRLEFIPPTDGSFHVRLDDVLGKGGAEYAYRLHVGPAEPDFELRISPASIRLPRGGTAIAEVTVFRRGGFTGPVELALAGTHPGITLDRASIPEGETTVPVTFRVDRLAATPILPLAVEGSARIADRNERRAAVPAEAMTQAFIYNHLVPKAEMVARVVEPNPVNVVVTLPRDRIVRARPGTEIVLGTQSQQLNPDLRRRVRLSLSSPPEWLQLTTTNVPRRGGGEIRLAVSGQANPGDTATVLLNGRTTILKRPEDPDYNPAIRRANMQVSDFPIAALTIEVIE